MYIVHHDDEHRRATAVEGEKTSSRQWWRPVKMHTHTHKKKMKIASTERIENLFKQTGNKMSHIWKLQFEQAFTYNLFTVRDRGGQIQGKQFV